MRHAATLDLADFEHAAYYDQLQQAQRESANRPVQMVSQVFGLARSLVTFGTLLALLVGLGPWIAAATLLAPIPAFISGSRYGWWGFQQMRRQSPVRRLMSYLTTLVTTDEYAKEIKLFRLGDHFIRRYDEAATGYYRGDAGAAVAPLLARVRLGLADDGGLVGDLPLRRAAGGAGDDLARAVDGLHRGGDAGAGRVSGHPRRRAGDLRERVVPLDALRAAGAAAEDHRARPSRCRCGGRSARGSSSAHVTYRYPGKETPALEDVSFTIAPGETVALVGRNGAGKTTIVKLLGRLYDPDEGQILIDGRDIREYDPEALRQQFAVMFQDYAAYQLSAGENIGVGDVGAGGRTGGGGEGGERRRGGGGDRRSAGRVRDAARQVVRGRSPALGRRVAEGGAGAGLHARRRGAQILILDEPTAALDARAEHELFARLRTLTRGRMALYISHRFSTVRMADRILVLDEGRLIEQGTHDELMALGGRYAELFELQAASYR